MTDEEKYKSAVKEMTHKKLKQKKEKQIKRFIKLNDKDKSIINILSIEEMHKGNLMPFALYINGSIYYYSNSIQADEDYNMIWDILKDLTV